jgi:hypothetical protein
MKQCMILLFILLFLVLPLAAQQRPLSALVIRNTQVSAETVSEIDLVSSPPSEKSVFLAIVASLAVPGLGEWYAGSFETGKYHMMAEGGLWLTYGGFRMYSTWLQRDAQTFARNHAGADFGDKNDQYSVNIGNFNTTADYNDAKARNREYALLYNTNSDMRYVWNWDTDANRLRFKDMRIHSGEVKNNSKFVIGAIVINHLFSAFSAGRKAAAYNKSLSMIDHVEIHTYALHDGLHIDGWGISMTTEF